MIVVAELAVVERTFSLFMMQLKEARKIILGLDYDNDVDVSEVPPHFHPSRPAGLNLSNGFAPQCETDCLRLHFSPGVVHSVWPTQLNFMHGSRFRTVHLAGESLVLGLIQLFMTLKNV